MADKGDDVKRILERYKTAEGNKSLWVSTFEECYEYALPQRESFYTETPGRKRTDRIFDETAVVGIQEFASRLQSGIVPNYARWADFVAGTEIPKEDEKEIYGILPRNRAKPYNMKDIISRLIDDSDFLNKLNKCEIEIQALEFVELRIFSALSAGQRVGPESSILKTRGTELQQKLQELSVEAIGYWASPFVYDTFANINEPSIGPDYAMTIAPAYFNGRKTTIYAGSNEIQRNIISKAVLGL